MKSQSVRMTMARVAFAAACVAIGGMMIACTSTPPPPPPAPGHVGEKVTGGGLSLTVDKVERKAELDKNQKAPEGKEYLITSVVLENAGDNDQSYNPMLNFKIKDGTGVEYTPELIATLDRPLKDGKLTKADKVSGNIAFLVDKKATDLELTFLPLVIFGNATPLKVKLDK